MNIEKRRAEIAARKAEIRKLIEGDNENKLNMDELEKELRELNEEDSKLEKRQAIERMLNGGAAPASPAGLDNPVARSASTTAPENTEKLYRSAWLKTLQGKPLTDEEKRAYSTAAGSALPIIPETTANQIIKKMYEVAPILQKCKIFHVPGNFKFAVEGENNIPKIIETGVKLLTSLITNLPQIIAEIVRAMPQIITGIVNALSEGISAVTEVGANLVRGLWSGIQSLAGWLWDKVSGWISSIWDGITDFFGIASPSKKMAWVSEMNVEGAVVGIEKNKGKAVKAYGEMGEEMLAEVDSGLAAVNDRLKDSIGEIETGFSAKATVEAVSASVPSDLTGRGGGSTSTGGGNTTVTNNFHIAELVVREEADIKKISRELYNMQKTKSRSKGVSMA